MEFYGYFEEVQFKQSDKIRFDITKDNENIMEGKIVGKSCLNPPIWIVKTNSIFSDVYPYDTIAIPQSLIIKEK